MRRFHLIRSEDVSGSSGCGTVAEGVEFSDGRVAMRWLVAPFGTGMYDRLGDVTEVHGHQGRTRVVVLDGAEGLCPAPGAQSTGDVEAITQQAQARPQPPLPAPHPKPQAQPAPAGRQTPAAQSRDQDQTHGVRVPRVS